MLSPKHKQQIRKLLQKVYQQPHIQNKKKNSPAQRFLLGSSVSSSQKTQQSRQSNNFNRTASSNHSAQRHKSPQTRISSNSRTAQLSNQMQAQKAPISQIFSQANFAMKNPYQSTNFSQTPKSPGGGGFQGSQGDPKHNEKRHYYQYSQHHQPHHNTQKQSKGPATYDSNTLKQLLADSANNEKQAYQHVPHSNAQARLQYQQSKLVGSSAQWDNIAMGIGSYKRDGISKNMENKQNDSSDYQNLNNQGFHQPLGGDIVTVHSGLGDEQIADYQLQNISSTKNNTNTIKASSSNKLHTRSDNGKENNSRGSQQLKKALFDYYLSKQLVRYRGNDNSSKSDMQKQYLKNFNDLREMEDQVYQIQKEYANDILNQLGLMDDSNSEFQDQRESNTKNSQNNNYNSNKDHYDTSQFIGIDERSQSQRKKYKTIRQQGDQNQGKQQRNQDTCSQLSIDYDPLPDPPYFDQERPPYYNQRIEQELVEFKKEIQYRFKQSQVNKLYVFPRTQKNYLNQQRQKKQRKKLQAEKEQLRRKKKKIKKQEMIQQRWKEIADQAISAAKIAATQQARRLIQEERRYAPITRNTMPTGQRYIYESPRQLGSKTTGTTKSKQSNQQRRQYGKLKNRGQTMSYQQERTLKQPQNDRIFNQKLASHQQMMTLQGDHISTLVLAEQQQKQQEGREFNRQQQRNNREWTFNNESNYSPSHKFVNNFHGQSSRSQTGNQKFTNYKNSGIPNRYQNNEKNLIHNKNKTYEFQHEILKSLSDQIYEDEERNAVDTRFSQEKGIMSVTDKYQKTIDLSKLGTNPYRRDGGLSSKTNNLKQQYQQNQPLRSESTKSKRGNQTSLSSNAGHHHHNRGQSMINGSVSASNNPSYHRPVCSTKNAIGPMISSRTQNNSYKSSQHHLNYVSMNPKKVNTNNGAQMSSKKFPQSTKQSTRPRSLKLAFQPALSNSTAKSITISSKQQQQYGTNATSTSIHSTGRKANKPTSSQPFSPYQNSIGEFRGNQTVAKSHAFQNSNGNVNLNATTGGIIGAIPKSIMNSKITTNGPPSSRSSSHRPPSNRGQHRFHPPQSSRFQPNTGNNFKTKGLINQTIAASSTSHHHQHHNSSHYNRNLFDNSIGISSSNNNNRVNNNYSTKNNHKIRNTFGTSQQQQHHTRSKTTLADSYQDFLQRLSPQTSSKKQPSERQSSHLKSRLGGSSSKAMNNNYSSNNNNNTMHCKNNDSSSMFRQSSQSAMAGTNFSNVRNQQQQRRGNSQMKQREFPNNDNLGYSGSGVTIMPWTLNPSMKISEYRGNNTSATVASSKINKGINTLAANKYNHHHHHHHHYQQQQSYQHHHNRSGTIGINSASSHQQNNGQTAPQKFASLKKQLSKINQNLKQTIRRMNTNSGHGSNNNSSSGGGGGGSGNVRSAVSSSREMNRQSSAQKFGGAVVAGQQLHQQQQQQQQKQQSSKNNQTAKIRISQLLNSQR